MKAREKMSMKLATIVASTARNVAKCYIKDKE